MVFLIGLKLVGRDRCLVDCVDVFSPESTFQKYVKGRFGLSQKRRIDGNNWFQRAMMRLLSNKDKFAIAGSHSSSPISSS